MTPERAALLAKYRAEHEEEKRVHQSLDALPIRELLAKRVELAPRIIRTPRRTMDQLAEQVGATRETMGEVLRASIAEYVARSSDCLPQPEDEDLPFFELLYELSLNAKQTETVQQDSWLKAFVSFDAFRETYLAGVDRRKVAMLRSQIEVATQKCVRPQRFVTLRVGGRGGYWNDRENFYEAAGTWALLPNKTEYFNRQFQFVEVSVIDEIVQLLRAGYKPSEYSHASGSAALSDIGQRGMLLSSAELSGEGAAVKTGEAGDARHGDGLWNVYGDRGIRGEGSYNTIAWFDEYFVTFGVNAERQEAYLQTLAPEDWKSGFYESLIGPMWETGKGKIVDFGGEGNLLGPRVPLTALDAVYAWKANEAEVRAWIRQFAPQAKFVSLEAVQALSSGGSYVNALAIQEGLTPDVAWESLKKQSVIIE